MPAPPCSWKPTLSFRFRARKSSPYGFECCTSARLDRLSTTFRVALGLDCPARSMRRSRIHTIESCFTRLCLAHRVARSRQLTNCPPTKTEDRGRSASDPSHHTLAAVEDLRAAFGDRLRALRVARRLSQEALAERADLHWTYISGVERGRRGPSLDVINRLAIARRLSPAELFGPLTGKYRPNRRRPRR